MKVIYWFPVLFFLLALVPSAGAVDNIEQTHVKYFDLSAPEGSSLSGVELYNLDPNSNTTIFFNNYGKPYTLQVNTTKSYHFWWDFDISLTSPNGSIETKHLTASAPLCTNYDMHVQYYWMSINGSLDTIFDLDLYAGIKPLNCELNAWNPLQSEDLQFSQIIASSSSYFDSSVFCVTQEEFEKQQNNSITGSLTEAAKDLFSWSWDMVITVISKIPYVGSYLASVLIMTALTIDTIIFYFQLLFIDYAETTFLTFEFFILSYSISKKGSFWAKLKRVADCHVRTIEFMLNSADAAVRLFSSIVQAIATAINSIKP